VSTIKDFKVNEESKSSTNNLKDFKLKVVKVNNNYFNGKNKSSIINSVKKSFKQTTNNSFNSNIDNRNRSTKPKTPKMGFAFKNKLNNKLYNKYDENDQSLIKHNNVYNLNEEQNILKKYHNSKNKRTWNDGLSLNSLNLSKRFN